MCLFCSIIKNYQAREANPISGLIGLNSSTGGTTKDNNKLGILKGAATVISGATITAHNCYGVGILDCSNQKLLNGEQPMNWEPVYRYEETIDNNNNESNLNKTTVTE